MKKFIALLLAVMMLSVSAFALAEEAGFDEYELGVEGEQEVGFMTMSMVYFQPVDMAPADCPIMVILSGSPPKSAM